MREGIHNYARIGLVHHMLYAQSISNPDDHAETLMEFAQRADIETFDCCLPFGKERRMRLIPVIRNCGKQEIAYAAHLFPLRKISLGSTCAYEQAITRMVFDDQIEMAHAIGATGFIFGSGADVSEKDRPMARAAFADFLRWCCGKLHPFGITAMLEPFDTTIDKKFLYGSTEDCAALIESLNPEIDNLGIELDMAHVPLMGETFKHAIKTVGPYLKRVHLGNCVIKDKKHPLYGDQHPPIGFDGGEIDVPELTDILGCLLDIGYLSREKLGNLVIEMTPWPGWTVEKTIEDSLKRLTMAWQEVTRM